MIRVRDLQASLDFYLGFLGLQEVRRKDLGKEASLIFLSDAAGAYHLELTVNHDGRDYELGNQFGHLAFHAPDLEIIISQVEAKGWWYRRSKPEAATPYIFVHDPDGYDIEILEKKV